MIFSRGYSTTGKQKGVRWLENNHNKENKMSQLKLNQGPDAGIADSRWKSLYRVGGAAALTVAVLFLIAIIDLITADIQTGTIFQNNFLVLIFKLHAGFSGVQEESLQGLNLLDITIVALIGTMSLTLYPALKRVNKAWAIVALSLPFIGLGLFIITKDTGRSGIIAAGLISQLSCYGAISSARVPLIREFWLMLSSLLVTSAQPSLTRTYLPSS
jgi:hypothetical protein